MLLFLCHARCWCLGLLMPVPRTRWMFQTLLPRLVLFSSPQKLWVSRYFLVCPLQLRVMLWLHVKQKSFQNCFRSFILQLVNIFQRVQRRWNNLEIISAAEIILLQFQTWLHVKQNTEIIWRLFHNNFISHVTAV